jgi:hypothetical protein
VTGRERRCAELVAIKATHSALFLGILGAILWLVATGVTGRRDGSVALAAGVVATEAGVFVANRGVCPLTPLAERYGARRGTGGVSDIFLPDALARTIPAWSTALLVVAAVLHLRALIRR